MVDINAALQACHFACPQTLPGHAAMSPCHQVKEEESVPQMSNLCINGNLCLGLPHPEFQMHKEVKKERKITHKPYCDICSCNGNVFIGVPYPEAQIEANQTAGASLCGHHPQPCCETPMGCSHHSSFSSHDYSDCCHSAMNSCHDCCHGNLGCFHGGMAGYHGTHPLVSGDDTACGDWLGGGGESGTHYTYDVNGNVDGGNAIELPCSANIYHGCPFQQMQVPFCPPNHHTLNNVMSLQ